MKFKDITPVVDNQLCLSCGICSVICPTDVISYKETPGGHVFPKISYDNCIDCSLCSDVCPGINFSKNLVEKIPEDPFVGNYNNVFTSASTDKSIFENSQSGGFVTGALYNALKQGLVEAVIVADMKEQTTTNPHASGVIITDPEDLYKTQKSKYVPIPLLTTLKEIEKSNLTFAIVGVSCHIHGLYNIIKRKNKLKRNLKFKIGLICDRVMTYAGMDYLISHSGVKDQIKVFEFRDKKPFGYPGYVKIQSQNKLKYLEPQIRMDIKEYFTPTRCRVCFDKMNVFSDITVGDPHGLNNVDNDNGESLVIVRTNEGKNLVQMLRNENSITYKDIDGDFIKGQKINQKINDWNEFISFFEEKNLVLPNYIGEIKKRVKNIDKLPRNRSMIEDKFNRSNKLFLCSDRKKLLLELSRKEKIIKIKSIIKNILFFYKKR